MWQRRLLAFLGGASANLGIPSSSLPKKPAGIVTAGGTLTRREAADEEPDLRGGREMETLTQMKCVACRKDAPTVTDAEVAEFHRQVAGSRGTSAAARV